MVRYGRRSSSGTSPEKILIPALLYGAGRNAIKSAIQPITDKIPLGANSDEAVMGIVGYFLAKKGSGIVRNIGMAALTVEAASIGNNVAGSTISGLTGMGGSNSSGFI